MFRLGVQIYLFCSIPKEKGRNRDLGPSNTSFLSILLGPALGKYLEKILLIGRKRSGEEGLAWGHCLWVLNNPFSSPPTHNPISISTPSSGLITMATIFSVALHPFLLKIIFFSAPPPVPQSLFSSISLYSYILIVLSFLFISQFLFLAFHLFLPASVEISLCSFPPVSPFLS